MELLLRRGRNCGRAIGAKSYFIGPKNRLGAPGPWAQFVFLALIVAFSASAWREPSHLKFIAYRALAEHLRNARLLAALGPVSQQVLASGGRTPSDDGTLR
jgi:hypothetical protein